MTEPRRRGTVEEYQNGRLFLYVTRWTDISDGRQHEEIEVHYNTNQLVLYTTDRKEFEAVIRRFWSDPESFV